MRESPSVARHFMVWATQRALDGCDKLILFLSQRLHVCVCGCACVCVVLCRALLEVLVFLSWLSSACVNPDTLCPYPSPICTGGERSHGTARSFSFAVSANPQTWTRRPFVTRHRSPPRYLSCKLESPKLTQLKLGTQTQSQRKLVWFTAPLGSVE